jgi:hypothetical protein
MVLNLASRPVVEARERSLVPACLQPRAPLTFEIRDEHDRRVPPTLAGYKLRWGKTYRLRVRTQDRRTENWDLRLLAPRRLVEPPEKSLAEGDARELTFETKAPRVGDPGRWFSMIESFPVQLEFTDGRASYAFTIPVILKASRSRWLVYLLFTALVSYLTQAWFREEILVPNLQNVGLIAGIWLVLVLVSIALDEVKFYRQALGLRGQMAASKGIHP